VLVLTGVGSVAVDDIRSQLGEREADVVLDVVRVAITRPNEVRRALGQATAAQLVVITRGGGEGVNVLDDEGLIEAVAACPVPVAVALGHATDDLVLGRVADACFATPTAFGAWLRGGLEEKRARARQVQEAEALAGSRDLLAQLGQLQRVRASLAFWRAVAVLLLVVGAGSLAWLLLSRWGLP
jgi:exodeoxyribonuclease VII large subunit